MTFQVNAIEYTAVFAAKFLSWLIAMPPAACKDDRDSFYDEHGQYERIRAFSVTFRRKDKNLSDAERVKLLDSWLDGLLKTFDMAQWGWSANVTSLTPDGSMQDRYTANIQLNHNS